MVLSPYEAMPSIGRLSSMALQMHAFAMHLKKTEFRFNHLNNNL
jgi:hypothetical protein